MVKSKKGYIYEATIPANTTAILYLPAKSGEVRSYGERAGGYHARGVEGWEGCVPIEIGGYRIHVD